MELSEDVDFKIQLKILRFRTYAVPLQGLNQQHYEIMMTHSALQQWINDGLKEPWRLASHGD